jgi:DNA-binding response OmpR family regulator
MIPKKTILFIDDNPVDRTLISRVLSKHDFNVLLAEDGITGLQMSQDEKPDLILLDILLPGISGIELCKKLNKNPLTHGIPVIFYTSIDTPKHLIDYASYGARDYLQKTMPPEELVAAIKAILK